MSSSDVFKNLLPIQCRTTSLGLYLYLLPSQGNLEEQTSCRHDVGQSSLCVLDGLLHHSVAARKHFHRLRNNYRDVRLTFEGRMCGVVECLICIFVLCGRRKKIYSQMQSHPKVRVVQEVRADQRCSALRWHKQKHYTVLHFTAIIKHVHNAMSCTWAVTWGLTGGSRGPRLSSGTNWTWSPVTWHAGWAWHAGAARRAEHRLSFRTLKHGQEDVSERLCQGRRCCCCVAMEIWLTTSPCLPGIPGSPGIPVTPLSPFSPLKPRSPFAPCG